MQKNSREMLRVTRTKEQAIGSYNRISKWYDVFAGRSEKKLREAGLRQLNAKEGETILEIGFGTGHCILELGKAVGDSGKVYGIARVSGYKSNNSNCLQESLSVGL